MEQIKLLLEIVWTFMKVDILSFGGGYVAIPLVEKQIVEVNKWMTSAEFADLLALDELTPGPIAINCATFVGNKMAGIFGGIAATFGCVLPTVLLAVILAKVYARYKGMKYLNGALSGMKCMVVALLASTAYSLFRNVLFTGGSLSVMSLIIFGVGLFVLRKYKPDPIVAILGCGALGFVLQLIGLK